MRTIIILSKDEIANLSRNKAVRAKDGSGNDVVLVSAAGYAQYDADMLGEIAAGGDVE